MELCDHSAVELSRMLRAGEISALEITESCLKRIRAVDGEPGQLDHLENETDNAQVHAFITVTPEIARQQAREIDKKLAAGEDPGPLAGIPFSVKIFLRQDTPPQPRPRILANFTAPTANPLTHVDPAG